MPGSTCLTMRPELARVLDGPVDAAISTHASNCPGCAAELAALRKAMIELSVARSEPPDPGQLYWDAFLPSVLDRIARTPIATRSSRGRRISAAAALLMLVASTAVLMTLPGDSLFDPQEAALHRIDSLLAAAPSRRDIVADLLNAMESDPGMSSEISLEADFTLEPAEVVDVLDALDALPARPEYLGLWDDRMERSVDRLDADAAAAFRVELARENG